MNYHFDHEKLDVYRASLTFIAWLEPMLEKLPRTFAVRDQLVLDCKNKRYSRQAIWVAGAARARSIPAAGCDERATKPAAQRANGYIAYFCNQALDRASTSIALNLAEGNGKFTAPDRCRFFDIARGSTLECAAALDVLAAKGRCESPVVASGKEQLSTIVSMLVGLIRANSDYRLHEEG